MRTKEKITVNPQDSITVNLEGSKDQLKNISIMVGIIVSLLTVFISCGVSVHTEKVEERKQLNNYLDTLNKIIIGKESGKETKFIDYRPSFAFELERIKEIDYLTRAYTRTLEPESNRIVLIYLYESDLINHSKAIGDEVPGQEGRCKSGKPSESLYCNLSTNRYYFDGIDMSDMFMQNIKLHNSYLNGAKFINAELMGAEFRGSELRKADFTNANLSNAFFNSAYNSETVLKGANFTDAKLQGSEFINADLSEANFTDANLTNADLTNANIQDTVFEKANLYGANLTGAKINNPNEITKSYNWWTAKYDPNIENQLPLSEEQKEWRRKNIN